MKKDPEHLLEVANSFKFYIPYTSGNITRFYATEDGKVYMNAKDSDLVIAGSDVYTIFPTDFHNFHYRTLSNGFVLKSNINKEGRVQKGDLICIVIEPYCKKIQKDISDYFRIESDIANIKEEIEDIKRGGFGMPLSMSSRFMALYHELFPRDKKQETESIARLNRDIANCKKQKAELYTNLMKYYKNEISYLRQYV